MFARSAARAARATAARRTYATTIAPAKPKSDFAWAAASLAVFGPLVLSVTNQSRVSSSHPHMLVTRRYLTSPPNKDHAHAHHTSHAKPAPVAHKPEQTEPQATTPGSDVSSDETDAKSDDADADNTEQPQEQQDKNENTEDEDDNAQKQAEEATADENSTPKDDVKEDSHVMKTKQIGKPKNVAEAAAASVRTHRAEKEQREKEKEESN
ncbi:hypothetical protein OIV83_006285 [Microbotryomycetes sp. JL201]|nr:hypothetical protein OIV83_006285 [Microbotryomycetes sp. JL201]